MPSFSPKPGLTSSVTSSPRNNSNINSESPRLTTPTQTTPRNSLSGNNISETPRLANPKEIQQKGSFQVITPAAATDINTHHAVLDRSSNQFFQIADVSQTGLDFATTYTQMGWFKFTAVPGSNGVFILMAKNGAGDLGYYLLVFTSAGSVTTIRAQVSDNTNKDQYEWAFQVSGTGMSLDQWYHIAITCDVGNASATTFVLYINGISQGNGSALVANNITGINDNAAPFIIGGNPASAAQAFSGDMDELKAFNTVLTPAQALDEMRKGDSSASGLQAFWEFDDDATDETANNNDLTETNTPTYTTTVQFTKRGATNRYYAVVGDGYTGHVLQTNIFATARNATDASESSSVATSGTVSIEKGASPGLLWTIRRTILPYNTSGVGVPLEAFMYFDVTTIQHDSNTPEPELGVVRTTQADTGTVTTADYNQFNTTDGIDKVDLIDLNVTQMYLTLNAEGLTWINRSGFTQLGLRMGGDIDNDSPTLPSLTEDRFVFKFSETSGTTNDPYIDITT